MYLISHRGNIEGKTKWENHPNYIQEAINEGFDVEIDVWFVDDKLYLGHDSPQYKIDHDFLINDKLWCHAKNIESLQIMNKYKNIHYFWHQEDSFTLTSKGIIWQYPINKVYDNSIFLMPENFNDGKIENIELSKGICSDYIKKYKYLSDTFIV